MAGSTRNLYLAASIAWLTAALFGYSVGYISGVVVLPSYLHHFQLDGLAEADLASIRSKVVTLWLVGALVGVPLAMPVCSKLGRQICLQFSAVLYIIGAGLQLGSHGDLLMFEAGRFLSGIGVGAGTLVTPMYISEISPPSERGVLMSGYQTVLQFCALIGFWSAFISHALFDRTSHLQWQLPVSIQLIPGIILLFGTFLIPETPRYLAVNGYYQYAEEALSWLRRLPVSDASLQEELQEIQEAALACEKLKGRNFFAEVSSKPDVRRRLGLGIGLMIAQNLAGMNALNYYAPVIFHLAGFTSVSSCLFLTGIFGATKLLSAAAFTFYFVHTRGNRFWLQFGSLLCGIAMCVVAYSTFVNSSNVQTPGSTLSGIISTAMVYLYAFFFGLSLGPVPWNICSEIFPLHINAECCATTTITHWVFQIVTAAATPLLLASVGWATYLLFGVSCLVCMGWVGFYLPETKGVPVGRSMDLLFGAPIDGLEVDNFEVAVKAAFYDEEDDIFKEEEEFLETTPLIKSERRRRSSVAAYV